MVKRDKEKDYTLELCPPPELSYSFTENTEESHLISHEIKNLKAEEKRIYEIENCEISKITEDNKSAVVEIREKEYSDKNPLDKTSKTLERLNIFEISHSQMF